VPRKPYGTATDVIKPGRTQIFSQEDQKIRRFDGSPRLGRAHESAGSSGGSANPKFSPSALLIFL
jgi:hypothetical protein